MVLVLAISVASILVAVLCGFVVGAVFVGKPLPRYVSPQLHEGVWGKALVNSDGSITWLRAAGTHFLIPPETKNNHDHVPYECTIAPGMAHEDRCACGARRHGVYGEWW